MTLKVNIAESTGKLDVKSIFLLKFLGWILTDCWPGSNGNEGVLHTSQISRCSLVSYTRHKFWCRRRSQSILRPTDRSLNNLNLFVYLVSSSKFSIFLLVMVMMENPPLATALELEPHHQMQFSVILKTPFLGGVLLLCRWYSEKFQTKTSEFYSIFIM